MNWTYRDRRKAQVVNIPPDARAQILCTLCNLIASSEVTARRREKSYVN